MAEFLGRHDLRNEPANAQSRIYYLLEDLSPGQSLEILTREDPTISLESTALQLRHRMLWEILGVGEDGWLIQVRHRDDVENLSLIDTLRQAQERNDRAFASAMHACNAANVALAPPFVREYGIGYRRFHFLESKLLPETIPQPEDPRLRAVLDALRAEYPKLLEEWIAIEASFDEDVLPEAWEVTPFFALLSGSLAKHEARKETQLYPVWDSLLKRPENAGLEGQLLARSKAVLAGEEDAHILP